VPKVAALADSMAGQMVPSTVSHSVVLLVLYSVDSTVVLTALMTAVCLETNLADWMVAATDA